MERENGNPFIRGIKKVVRKYPGNIGGLVLLLGGVGVGCALREHQSFIPPENSHESCVLVKAGEQIPIPRIQTSCFLREVKVPGGRALAVVTPTGFEGGGIIKALPGSTIEDVLKRMSEDPTEGGRWAVFTLKGDPDGDKGVTGFNAFDSRNNAPVVVTFSVKKTDQPDVYCVGTAITP